MSYEFEKINRIEQTSVDPDNIRGQIDTGAKVSCTNMLFLLHEYKPYTRRRPSKIRMTAAISDDNSDIGIIPKGEGYLHIPSANTKGYIRIKAYYSPYLTSTLISENSIMGDTAFQRSFYIGQVLRKYFTVNTFSIFCEHRIRSNKNIQVDGVLINRQCFTHPLIPPNLEETHPMATPLNSLEKAKLLQTDEAKYIERLADVEVQRYKSKTRSSLKNMLEIIPRYWKKKVHFDDIIEEHTIPVNAMYIRSRTERLLWHQRLGHPCDEYLYNAHTAIDGVPRFKTTSSIFDTCPTCIRAKQTKSTPGSPTLPHDTQAKPNPNHHSTRSAKHPYQGLSIDFSFSGMTSKDSERRNDFEGINGETAWILITDHFTGIKHGDTRISKAAPVLWLKHFLAQYNPLCRDKYVYMDQGGELFNNPEVKNLFHKSGYEIKPTGADASHQNGPVERGHRTIADMMRSLLTGANLDPKFWPYAFYHSLRLSNAIPERHQALSPLELATRTRENFTNLKTFGCRVWVRPPGKRKAKLIPNSKKGIFLGYVPYTMRNILWYDPDTSRVKIANHARYDEGYNDLPPSQIPPNVIHLQRIDQDGQAPPADTHDITTQDLHFYITPFAELLHRTVKLLPKSNHPLFGFNLVDDELLQRTYIKDIAPKSPASKIFSTLKSTRRHLRGAYLISINHHPVFTTAQASTALQNIQDEGVYKEIDMIFAPEQKMSIKDVRKAANDYGLFAPTTKWDDTAANAEDDEDPPFLDREQINKLNKIGSNICKQMAPIEDDMEVSIPSLDIHSLRAITKIRYPEIFEEYKNNEEAFDQNDITAEYIELMINAIQSKSTTPEEQALGFFTRKKLKKLNTWNEWKAGETKQMNQFADLQMFGKPIMIDPKTKPIILRPHWQYNVKRDGTRRARLCCNGSKYAAPILHALAMTYSSCVEHPIQRLFFAIAAQLNLKVYGGDAKDAYAHSPGSHIPTYLSIDDAYAEWYSEQYGKDIDRKLVLPIQRALQGSPESGRLWEEHCNRTLMNEPLNFETTTHDKTIYHTTYKGEKIYLLRQVDDFALACDKEDTAKEIYSIIGSKLKLPKEPKDPFAYLGLITDFNGIDVTQTKDYIEISCSNYIDRIMTSHGWETTSPSNPNTSAPLSTDVLHQLQHHADGPKEGTIEHRNLQEKQGFSYQSLLGEIMYAYVSCRPDIGYAITLLSKYGSNPSAYHYHCVKHIAKYLRSTKDWGIIFKRSSPRNELDSVVKSKIPGSPITLPKYPEDIAQPKLICFVDAAYGNNPTKRRSTTGFALTYSGGAIVYKSKAQSITALSSTEAELIAAVTAAKTVRFIRSVLTELGFHQMEPTPIYEDNASAIEIINASKPTGRSRHIDIRFFAIQDWKRNNDIKMVHIPGVINPADDLTKPLGWVLHSRHARYIMGHRNIT